MATALVDQSIHPKVFTDPQSQPLPAYLDSIRKMFEQAVLGAFSQSLIVHSRYRFDGAAKEANPEAVKQAKIGADGEWKLSAVWPTAHCRVRNSGKTGPRLL